MANAICPAQFTGDDVQRHHERWRDNRKPRRANPGSGGRTAGSFAQHWLGPPRGLRPDSPGDVPPLQEGVASDEMDQAVWRPVGCGGHDGDGVRRDLCAPLDGTRR